MDAMKLAILRLLSSRKSLVALVAMVVRIVAAFLPITDKQQEAFNELLYMAGLLIAAILLKDVSRHTAATKVNVQVGTTQATPSSPPSSGPTSEELQAIEREQEEAASGSMSVDLDEESKPTLKSIPPSPRVPNFESRDHVEPLSRDELDIVRAHRQQQDTTRQGRPKLPTVLK